MARAMGRSFMVVLLVAVLVGLGWLWTQAERPAARNVPAAAGVAAAGTAPVELATTELLDPALPVEAERRALGREGEPASSGAAQSSGEAVEGHDDVLVLVVDPSGKPRAGIPLRLEPGANDGSGAHVPGPQVTDASGRARLVDIRRVLEDAVEPWTLRHELPSAEPPSLALVRSTLAGPEVVSVLPAGGALEVVVRELDGSLAPEKSEVKLVFVREEERLNPVLSGPEWKAELRAGAARFPWVELGRTWDVRAFRPEGMAPSRQRVRGPSAPDEVVRVEIVLGADHPVVSFRALDPQRRPLASVVLQLTRSQMFGIVESSLTTDAEGRFTIDADEPLFGSREFLVTHRLAAGSPLQARATLPNSPQVGWNDGGDLVLEPEPVLCAGRVTDEDGRPFAGAEVVAGPDHGWLDRSQSIRDASDEHGRFELRGLWNGDDFELHAEQNWPRSNNPRSWRMHILEQREPETRAGNRVLRSDSIRARQGELGLELVLTARYSFSGRLLVDPGIDPGAVQFQLKNSADEPVPADRRGALFGDDEGGARFALQPVPAGQYELRCLLEGLELARLEGLALRDDTDIGSIDLRGRLHVSEILLLGAEESAKVAGEFVWKPHGSDERHTGHFDGRLVRILTPSVPIDVALRPRGYRHAELENLSGRRELVLAPPLHVRLVLHTDGEFPDSPWFLRCRLGQDGVDVGEPRGMPYFTRDSREVELSVSTAGRLRVSWNLERRVEGANFGGATWRGVLDGHEVEIEVRDVPGLQVFPIPLDAAALTALAQDPAR